MILKEDCHPEPGAFCRAKDLGVLRDAPPRRNNRAFSTLLYRSFVNAVILSPAPFAERRI